MKNENFTHLHRHGTRSLLDGMSNSDEAAQLSKSMGFCALAQTDHGNIDGAIKFQEACLKNNVTPIQGIEFYCVRNALLSQKDEVRYHLTVWIQNLTGWQNVLRLLTKANLEGFYRKPRISYDWLLEHAEGLVLGTACVQTFLKDPEGINFLKSYLKEYDQDVFVEIMPHITPEQIETNELCLEIAKKYDLPLVASNDCHWDHTEDAETQEVLLAIQTKRKWEDPDRWKFDKAYKLHLKSADEMIQEFAEQKVVPKEIVIQAMRNTLKVGKLCGGFKIPKQEIDLPMVPELVNQNENYILEQLALQGLYDKIGMIIPPEYEDRLDEELEIIRKKGFARYFLIVWDLIKWAKSQDILTGIGRGSSGCALVAYLMNITHVDPIKYHLPFARFINEERIDWPDIDMDFPDNKRQMVIDHIKEIYGENQVFGISTFLKMKGRMAIRDVARVFDAPEEEVDWFAKSIDGEISSAEEYEKFKEKYPKIIYHAEKLEGKERSAGRHAAGIVISKEDLRNGQKANLVQREKHTVVNWSMQDCEYSGLVKFDILGLSTLTVLAEAKKLIKHNQNIDIDYYNLPLDDENIYKDISNGNVVGIFQMGHAVSNILKSIPIENFEQWCHLIALGRPGPLESGMTEDYIRRRKGGEWKKKHPIYEEVTKDTLGVIVTQEQVMNVFHKVAGLPYSTADRIRKVIGKKRDPKEFEPYKAEFAMGCREMGTMNSDEVEEFWEGLLKHARYGFNMSHAVCYSLIGYYTAYIKYYCPAEFICATLTHDDKTSKNDLLKEAQRIGLEVVPPKIGLSDPFKWVAVADKLYTPFVEIKGVGDKMAAEIHRGGRQRKKKGFYNGELEFTPATKKMLEEIKAFDLLAKLPTEALNKFDFDIFGERKDRYPKLFTLVGEKHLDSALQGKHRLNLVKEQTPHQFDRSLIQCTRCELRKEAKQPVPCTGGEQNMMIVMEGPGFQENKQGWPAIGDAGNYLWTELKKYDLYRIDFHMTNVTRCFPGKNTPTFEHVNICANRWLLPEIVAVKPYIILALGSRSYYYFTGKESGIMKANASIEWNEDFGCYVVYGIHPSAALRNPSNKPLFAEAIKFFSSKIEIIGGI